MPRTRLGGRSRLLFLLLLFMRSSVCIDTTIVVSADNETTETTPVYALTTTEEGGTNAHPPDIAASSSSADDFITSSSPEPEPECPEGFKQLTIDWCFHLRYDMDNRMDFKDVQDYCTEKKAILPAITSVEVTTALMLERTNRMGISPMEVFYIGLECDTRSHQWKWLEGPNFDPSEAFFQRPFTDVDSCSRLDYNPYVFDQFGTWTSMEKLYDASLAVCATRPAGYSPTAPSDKPCSEPWTALPGGYCYKMQLIGPGGINIYDAEQQCRYDNSHLPAIWSSEQANLIQAYLIGKGKQNGQFWIGLYCNFGDGGDNITDYALEVRGTRAWIDGTPFSQDYTNFLDKDDNTTTCNVKLVNTFLYNGALLGKWQKEIYNNTLSMLMCSRPHSSDPEATSPTTASTKKITQSTRKTTVPSSAETTTDVAFYTTSQPSVGSTTADEVIKTTIEEHSSIHPEDTTPKVVTTTIITTIVTTTLTPATTSTLETTTTQDRRPLTQLELILIVSLAIIVIAVILVVLVYFLCKRIRKEQIQEVVKNMQKRFSRSNTNIISKFDEWEIKRQFVGIDYSRQLGRGAFGSVYLGRVFSGNIPDLAVKTHIQLNTLKKDDDFVAVKTLHESADREATVEFLEEIKIMKKIGFHERLVNILGCVTETEPLLLIVEYCSNGDLLKFMRDRRMFMLKLKDTVGDSVADRHSIITHRQQLMFGIQIAYGMEYLAQRGFVHRDLAARNILVDQNETCKIGDFGLCREIGKESDQYISRGGRLPWKWMAPEALEKYYFSVESDVWAFGILLFEIITLGGNPYPDWAAVELLPRLKSGQRMAKPDICSEAFYEIMMSCWRGVPLSRLSFEKIRRKLAYELEESTSEDYYLKLDGAAKYYQETLEFDNRQGRFNSF